MCEVDSTLVDAVLDYMDPIIADSTRLSFYEEYGYKGMLITGIDRSEPTGDLMASLQFQNNDFIIDVDSMPVASMDDVTAVGDHLLKAESTTITLIRNRVQLQITYSYPR